MEEMQVAVLSDIHGNRWALEAVLADIRRRGIGEIFNLGDSLYGPLDPAGTAEILLELDLPTVSGNEDRVIIETSGKAPQSPTLGYVRSSLTGRIWEWLKVLPVTLEVQNKFFLCHGSPACDSEYLLVKVEKNGVIPRDRTELRRKISEVKQPVVFCGHDHVPRTVRLPGEKLIVNPGSVGLPAYIDDHPYPHKMETSTPHARYAIVRNTESGWRVEDISVPYEWKTASAWARKNKRLDWVQWLISGRA